MKTTMKWMVGVAMAATLAGCATSSLDARKQEKAAAYAALSPGMKESVDRGAIQVGMPMDAVYIAWGKPDKVQTNPSDATVASWFYYGGYTPQTGTSYMGWQPTQNTPSTYMKSEVDFTNGFVKAWQTFPAPP